METDARNSPSCPSPAGPGPTWTGNMFSVHLILSRGDVSGHDIIMGCWDFVPPPGGISCVDTAHTALAGAGQVTVLDSCAAASNALCFISAAGLQNRELMEFCCYD